MATTGSDFCNDTVAGCADEGAGRPVGHGSLANTSDAPAELAAWVQPHTEQVAV